MLSNPAKRRLFDSVDAFANIDDFVPSVTKDPATFYKNFGAAFAANARWLEKQPVPVLGDENATEEEVEAFYAFWLEISWQAKGQEQKENYVQENFGSKEDTWEEGGLGEKGG